MRAGGNHRRAVPRGQQERSPHVRSARSAKSWSMRLRWLPASSIAKGQSRMDW